MGLVRPRELRWARAAAGLAAVTPVVYVLVTVVLGFALPGYSVIGDTQSELGAVDAPRGWVMNVAGFMALGVAMLALAAAYWVVLRPGALVALAVALLVVAGVGTVTVGFFPCDPGCVDVTSTGRAHSAFSAPGAIGLPAAAVVSAWVFRTDPRFGPSWATASLLVGGVAFISGPLVGLEMLDSVNGLIQRFGMWTALAWMSGVGLRLWRVLGDGEAP